MRKHSWRNPRLTRAKDRKPRRLYDDPAWRRLSRRVAAEEPYCRTCLAAGQHVISQVTDHIAPHRGSRRLFWDRRNLQRLCKKCHDAKSLGEMFDSRGVSR